MDFSDSFMHSSTIFCEFGNPTAPLESEAASSPCIPIMERISNLLFSLPKYQSSITHAVGNSTGPLALLLQKKVCLLGAWAPVFHILVPLVWLIPIYALCFAFTAVPYHISGFSIPWIECASKSLMLPWVLLLILGIVVGLPYIVSYQLFVWFCDFLVFLDSPWLQIPAIGAVTGGFVWAHEAIPAFAMAVNQVLAVIGLFYQITLLASMRPILALSMHLAHTTITTIRLLGLICVDVVYRWDPALAGTHLHASLCHAREFLGVTLRSSFVVRSLPPPSSPAGWSTLVSNALTRAEPSPSEPSSPVSSEPSTLFSANTASTKLPPNTSKLASQAPYFLPNPLSICRVFAYQESPCKETTGSWAPAGSPPTGARLVFPRLSVAEAEAARRARDLQAQKGRKSRLRPGCAPTPWSVERARYRATPGRGVNMAWVDTPRSLWGAPSGERWYS